MKNFKIKLINKMVGADIKNLFRTKKQGGKEIIIEVGLAVIGVALLVIFKDEVGDLITTLVTSVSDKIKALFGTI